MSHVVTARITDEEWVAFQGILVRYNITIQQLLHGIITDALVDEGYDALRRRESEGCEGPGEASKTCGAATP